MFFSIAGLILLACFYGVYFGKMLRQRKAGIRTDQLGADKTGKEKTIERGVRIASAAVVAAELISLLRHTASFSLPLRIAGLVLSLIGTVLFIAAVVTMKDNWRAGVPANEHTSLVTTGIYRLSRNPAFLGFDLVYLGFFLMFANLPLGLISLSAILLFHLQIVEVEEKYLRKTFGREYADYCREVCRYLGSTTLKKSDLAAMALLTACGAAGLMSWNTGGHLSVVNQYGQNVTLWGTGIYARDSVIKAAGFIGSDLIVLLVLLPLFLHTLRQNRKNPSPVHRLKLTALYSASLYYAASMAFGATYNRLMLGYTALLGLSFFRLLLLSRGLTFTAMKAGNGLKLFIALLSGALCLAWLPDILTSWLNNAPLALQEVYTTETTYVLDIGIICPMGLLGLALLQRKDPAGAVMISALLTICLMAGLMVISQSVFQHYAGIVIPFPQLATKVLIFVVLSAFSLVLQKQWYAGLQ